MSHQSMGCQVKEGCRFLLADSDEERAVFEKAKHQKRSKTEENGLKIKIKVSEGMNNGCDFDVFAVINNNADSERMCRLMFGARTATYNGTLGPECGSKDLLNVALQPYGGKPSHGSSFSSPFVFCASGNPAHGPTCLLSHINTMSSSGPPMVS